MASVTRGPAAKGLTQSIRIVLPDAGVLISLAHGQLLDLLFAFSEDVRLIVPDVAAFEATRRSDLVDANRISQFLAQHSARITVEPTQFDELLAHAKANPDLKLPVDLGEISIYGYVNALRADEPGVPVLVLFEDTWFLENQSTRPRNTHLLSLAAFLRHVTTLMPNLTYEAAMEQIKATRPHVSTRETDIASEGEPRTSWKSKTQRP